MIWGVAGLWAAFALLLLVGAGEFLLACGLGIGWRAWNYCPAAIDHAAILSKRSAASACSGRSTRPR